MQALVTILPEPFFQAIEDIWVELESRFDCQHVYARPKPHFTWQYADSYDDSYAQALERICLDEKPFEVQTDIVTRFSTFDPVVFLRIVPTPEILELHQKLWDGLSPYWNKPSLLYQPGDWVPHITLSMTENGWCNPGEVREFLFSRDLRWTFKVDRLVMLSLNDQNSWDDEKEFLLGPGLQ